MSSQASVDGRSGAGTPNAPRNGSARAGNHTPSRGAKRARDATNEFPSDSPPSSFPDPAEVQDVVNAAGRLDDVTRQRAKTGLHDIRLDCELPEIPRPVKRSRTTLIIRRAVTRMRRTGLPRKADGDAGGCRLRQLPHRFPMHQATAKTRHHLLARPRRLSQSLPALSLDASGLHGTGAE